LKNSYLVLKRFDMDSINVVINVDEEQGQFISIDNSGNQVLHTF